MEILRTGDMVGLSEGMRMLNQVASGGGGGASFATPSNYHLYPMGDSRTAQGVSKTGTFAATINFSSGTGGDPAAWFGTLTGHKVRYGSSFANAGGGSQTVEQILAYPRTGTNTIDLSQVAANEAGIVVLLMGTNNSNLPATLSPGGTARVALQNAIGALTSTTTNWVSSNGAYNAPLPHAGGVPKCLIIVNETPRGVASDNSLNNAITPPSDAATFEAWATWLSKFDYASGDAFANPRVFVIDAFHNAAILNLADGRGTNLPFPGLLADGLHPTPQGTYAIANVGVTRLASVLPLAPTFAEPPTTASVISAADNITPNPLFLAGAPGGNSLGGATLVTTAPQPATIVFEGSNMTGLTVEVVSVNALGGVLGNEMVLRITGTSGATAPSFKTRQDVSGTIRPNIDFSSTSPGFLRATIRERYTIVNSNTLRNTSISVTISNASGTMIADSELPAGLTNGYAATPAYQSNYKNDYIDLSTVTPRTITSQTLRLADSTVVAPSAPTFIRIAHTIFIQPSKTIDITIGLSQMGAKVVSD